MKNLILLFCAMMIAGLSYGQFKVIANGNCGAGNANPQTALEVSGLANPELRISENSSTTSYFRFTDVSSTSGVIEKVANTGSSLIDINPISSDGVGNASFRFFRLTNTTGAVRFNVFRGNGTGAINSQFGGNVSSYLNKETGNVGIGKSSPTEKLDLAGAAFKTVGGDLWNVPSDAKLKDNVKDYKKGLDLILDMNPVEYTYNGKAGTTKGEYQIGVLAQDLQKIAPFMVKDHVYIKDEVDEFGNVKIIEEEEFLSINASALKWITVNAIKQQQEIIDSQEDRIEELEAKLNEVLDLVKNNEILNLTGGKAALGQNRPNPFKDETTIDYFIPERSANAQIEVFNINGQLIETKNIDHTGIGNLKINAKDMASGAYSYRLIVDGQVVGTNKMILQN